MKEMNALEEQLKSWRPRRASAALERSLFGERAKVPHWPQAFGLLAPATACLLFVAMIARQREGSALQIGGDNEELVTVLLSNQNYAAFLPGSFRSEQNRWDTF